MSLKQQSPAIQQKEQDENIEIEDFNIDEFAEETYRCKQAVL